MKTIKLILKDKIIISNPILAEMNIGAGRKIYSTENGAITISFINNERKISIYTKEPISILKQNIGDRVKAVIDNEQSMFCISSKNWRLIS